MGKDGLGLIPRVQRWLEVRLKHVPIWIFSEDVLQQLPWLQSWDFNLLIKRDKIFGV